MLPNNPQLVSKPKNYVAKLMESVAVIKVTFGVNTSECIPPVFAAKLKLVISEQSVSVNVGSRMWQPTSKQQ